MLQSLKNIVRKNPTAFSFAKKVQSVFEPKPSPLASSPSYRRPANPDWSDTANKLPWFDMPDAEASISKQLETGLITTQEAELLAKWLRDGYVILDDFIDNHDVDKMIKELDALFTSEHAHPGLSLLGMTDTNGKQRNFTHSEILSMSEAEPAKIKNTNWRIHGFHEWSQGTKNLYLDLKLQRVVSLLFGKKAVPYSTINFMYGSAQEIHQDMTVFHIFPHNYLIGAWIAGEDVDPASGPLTFYPGSHREKIWKGFKDYPQSNLRTATPEESLAYHAYIAERCNNYERTQFIAKKGQVLLWHGLLLHGGSPIANPKLSRKSLVTHYLIDGVNQAEFITGKTNW